MLQSQVVRKDPPYPKVGLLVKSQLSEAHGSLKDSYLASTAS